MLQQLYCHHPLPAMLWSEHHPMGTPHSGQAVTAHLLVQNPQGSKLAPPSKLPLGPQHLLLLLISLVTLKLGRQQDSGELRGSEARWRPARGRRPRVQPFLLEQKPDCGASTLSKR